MRDHFRRCYVAKAGAGCERQAARDAEQETRRILIACAGRVDHLCNRFGRHGNRRAVAEHDRALLAARHSGNGAFRMQRAESGFKIIGLIEGFELGFVGEHDVGIPAHELAEAGAVPVHAETVRQRDRDLAARCLGNLGGVHEGGLGLVLVEQIALQIENAAVTNHLGIDVVLREENGGAEEGVHAAVPVIGDEDDGARGGRSVRQRTGVEGHAARHHLAHELVAKVIVGNLADIAGGGAEAR